MNTLILTRSSAFRKASIKECQKGFDRSLTIFTTKDAQDAINEKCDPRDTIHVFSGILPSVLRSGACEELVLSSRHPCILAFGKTTALGISMRRRLNVAILEYIPGDLTSLYANSCTTKYKTKEDFRAAIEAIHSKWSGQKQGVKIDFEDGTIEPWDPWSIQTQQPTSEPTVTPLQKAHGAISGHQSSA